MTSLTQLIAGNPWPSVAAVLTVGVCFLGVLFRDVVRETLLGWLKTKRERNRKIAEAKCLFTDGEREILMAMAKKGDQLRISVSDLLGGGPPLIVGSGNTEVPLREALPTDVFNLRNKGYLVDSGKSRYSLTEKGQAAGEELIRLFGCHDAKNTSCTH